MFIVVFYDGYFIFVELGLMVGLYVVYVGVVVFESWWMRWIRRWYGFKYKLLLNFIF